MNFNFGGFLFFNALCDLFDKVAETPSAPSNQPMPTKIVVAAIAFVVCTIATLIIIACTI